MANYNTLKTSIEAVIKQNGNNEITGPILQQTLLAMVNSLGVGYQYAGIATPTTNPGTPDQNVFYIASTAGTYTNFGGLVLADGEIAILKWNGAWSKDSTGAASLEKLNQLGQKLAGEILYSANKTIAAGGYRVIITDAPTVQEDKIGYVKVTGLNEGTVSLATSGWSGVLINFKGGEKIYCTIPADRPNIVVANKDNEPLDASTQISIEIGVDGINSLLGKEIQDSESFKKSIPFMDISKLYPTSGTDGTDVYTQTNARNIVPVNMREKGLILMYKTANGIVIEQFPGDDVSNTRWVYGGWHTLGISDFINLNTYHSKSDSYTDADEAKGAVPLYWRRGGIIIRFKLASGWVTMQLNNDSWTTADDKWQTIATNEDIGYLLETIRYSATEYRLDKSDLINGYRANATSPVGSSSIRVTTRELIKVNKGDVITLLDYNFSYYFTVWNDSLDTIIQTKNYNFSRATIAQDGYLLLLIENRVSPSSTIDVADVYDKIIISRYGVFEKPNLEYVKSSDFIKGYIDADGHIQPHSTRFVNWRGLTVKKGDLVYAVVKDLHFFIVEYNNNTSNKITDSNGYYQSTPVPFGNANYCGYYVVKNDGYIMCQCSDDSESPDYDTFAKYNNGIVVIHIDNNSIRMLAEGVYKKTPTASKRGKSIVMPSTYGREMQAGTVVGEYLYIQVDNYQSQADSKKIVVINKETGALVNTLATDLHGSMSYNPYNDTLLASIDGKILLYKNASVIDTSIMSSDADVVVDLEEEETLVYCWGEDDRTVYAVNSYDGSTPATQTRWIFEKIILGVTNGEYDGTYAIDKVYDGVVNEGIDTYHAKGQGNQNYIQDLDFDGYLYVAVGTSGHNFLVVDLDDHTSTFRVVGNYNHKYYDSDRVEHYLEPELVALDGGYIYCGSRSWSENIYELLKFTR